MKISSNQPQTGEPQVEEVSFDDNPDLQTDRKGQQTDRKLVDEKGPQRRKGWSGGGEVGEVELQDRGQGVQALHKESVIEKDLPQSALDDQQFEKQMCFGRCCQITRSVIMHFSALLSFLIFNTDILYALRAPFQGNYMKHFVFLLMFRYGLLFLVWIWWTIRNRAVSGSNVQESQETGSRASIMLFKVLKNLRGMPIFIAFGFYKLLPFKDFQCEIIVGYVIEIITSVFPMLSVQVMNNSENPGHLTWLQVTNMSFRITSLLLLFLEAMIFCWDSFMKYKMRDTNIRQYKKLSEQQRVEVYGPRHSKVATIGVISSLIMLFLGSMFISRRTCIPANEDAPMMVLEWGVCQSCQGNCKKCSTIDKCEGCHAGFYLSPETNQCIDCDSHPNDIDCFECLAPHEEGANPKCLTCAPGLLLDPKTETCRTCQLITGVDKCTECDPSSRQCNTCEKGYYLPEDYNGVKTQACMRCHDQFEFCGHCMQGRCWKCMEHVAKFDQKDKCTKCQDPWVSMNGEWGRCYCPAIAVLGADFQCEECHELLPQCRRCKYSREVEPWEIYKWVGWDDKMSALGVQYVETDRSQKPEFISCVEGDQTTTADIRTVDGKDQVVKCDTLIQGCGQCSSSTDNTQVTCNQCQDGHYLIETKAPMFSDKFGIYTKDKCSSCSKKFQSQCLECNQQTCTKCSSTYEIDKWSGDCIKCQYEWMCQQAQD